MRNSIPLLLSIIILSFTTNATLAQRPGIYPDSFSSVDINCFIRKPIENEELVKRVREIITAN